MAEQRAQKSVRERRPVSSSPVPRPSSHFRGLTLVELVIVCGIIAMLAGILWVVMGPVREKARQMVCISNLTQIGHAFRMYRDDWDGVEPQKGVQLEYWQLGLPPFHPMDRLEPYLRNKEVWRCPTGMVVRKVPFPILSTYWPHYCAHEDVVDPFLPPHEYDECILIGPSAKQGFISFKWAVAHFPEWPILICDDHVRYYFPNGEWGEGKLLGVHLPDFSVRWFSGLEIMLKLPLYQGLK